MSLFGDAAAAPAHVLVETRDWTEAERLQHEKAALGFYLSGHPYAAYAAELAPDIDVARSLGIPNLRYFGQTPWGGGASCGTVA